jgi:hypothetical protein
MTLHDAEMMFTRSGIAHEFRIGPDSDPLDGSPIILI